MKIAKTRALPGIAVALAVLGGQAALAEEYRLVTESAAQACQSGTKSDWTTHEGDRDITVDRADGDKLNVAVCVGDESQGIVNVRWKANGYWKSSGNVSEGCAEIIGASKVKVRPVNSNFHDTATYYTCVKE